MSRVVKSPGPFLTARWLDLLLLNFAVDPRLLAPLVPAGTELDLWNGEAVVSVVGFRFVDTRLLGVPLPAHRDFEEVNLRFYVRRRVPDRVRRAVVFVRELVPESSAACLVPGECCRDIELCRSPNEQARHYAPRVLSS